MVFLVGKDMVGIFFLVRLGWLVETREARGAREACANMGRNRKGNGYFRAHLLVWALVFGQETQVCCK